ncbi:MAG: hypothetical protein WC464_01985 [Bdellovibrionales bacterium]
MLEHPTFNTAEQFALGFPKMTFAAISESFPDAPKFIRNMSATVKGDSWVEPSTARLIYAQVVQKLPCENPLNNVANAPPSIHEKIKEIGFEKELKDVLAHSTEKAPPRPGTQDGGSYWDEIIHRGVENYVSEKAPRDHTVAKGCGEPKPQ